MCNPRRGKVLTEALEARCLLSAAGLVATPFVQGVADAGSGSSSVQGYTPSQISTAYGFDNVQLSDGNAGTGAGETIAIVDAYNDPNIAADLGAFDSQFNLPAPPKLTVVSQSGSTTELPVTDASWDEEISLDVEWAHAMAPGAKILLVETNSDNLNSLMAGVVYAAGAPNVSVVSMSWGSTEFSGETAYDSDFITPGTHKGVTFVAAAGDNGSFDGPNWPADSPNVLSVGGTTLATSDSTGTYEAETPWQGTTGGISGYEDEPTYQGNVQTTGNRTAPDVAYVADPNTGVAVYDSVAYEGATGWIELGGTSVGAPQWSALVAIADQDRALTHSGTLNGASATLPKLYALANDATTYADNFNPITTYGFFGQVSTSNGYSIETGLGSPIASAIVPSLAAGDAGTRTTATLSAPIEFRPRIHFPIRYFTGERITYSAPGELSGGNETSEPVEISTPGGAPVADTPVVSTAVQYSTATVTPMAGKVVVLPSLMSDLGQTAPARVNVVSTGVEVFSEPAAVFNAPAAMPMAAAQTCKSPFRDGAAIGGGENAGVGYVPPIAAPAARIAPRAGSGWYLGDLAYLNMPVFEMPFGSTHLPPLEFPSAGLVTSALAWSELSVAVIATGMWIVVYRQGRRRTSRMPVGEFAGVGFENLKGVGGPLPRGGFAFALPSPAIRSTE